MPNPESTPPSGGGPTDADPLGGLTVEFVRSPRRHRTISGRLKGSHLIVSVPSGLTAEEERTWAEQLAKRVLEKERRRALNDAGDLLERTQELNRRYFGGRLSFSEVRYVTNQNARFGSCTPAHGTIRISDRVATMPPWVRDAVLVHELAHLLELKHSPRFWELANAYPLMERARGYLIAVGLDDAEEGGE